MFAVPQPTSMRFPRTTKYMSISARTYLDPVPLHLNAQYDELYEACWRGDNIRIQELCSPNEASGSTPIRISVKATTPIPGNESLGRIDVLLPPQPCTNTVSRLHPALCRGLSAPLGHGTACPRYCYCSVRPKPLSRALQCQGLDTRSIFYDLSEVFGLIVHPLFYTR